jgi:hypothetical protein
MKIARKKLSVILCTMVLVLGFVGTSNAFLYDRGNGLIYDSDQNITWLQDANLAATENFGVSGIESGSYIGFMSWNTAEAWIEAMNTADYKGYNNWRLPTTVDGPCVVWGYDGTTTAGYNITTSEMGYMYYVNLGNKGLVATDGTDPQPGWGLNNVGPFINLQSYDYWSGTEYSANPGLAWDFLFYYGLQGLGVKDPDEYHYAWAVRDGDVSAVPIPGAGWLLGSGLIGLVEFGRKFRKA